MEKNNVFTFSNMQQKAIITSNDKSICQSKQSGLDKYASSVKKMLKNYTKMERQTKSCERRILQFASTWNIALDAKTLQTLSMKGIAEKIADIPLSGKIIELHCAYLKSRYILQLLDDALEDLQTFEDGDMQCAVLTEMCINNVLRDDLEFVLEESGFPMSKTTAYRVLTQALENMAVLIWGYEAIEDETTEELFSSEFLNLVNDLAA